MATKRSKAREAEFEKIVAHYGGLRTTFDQLARGLLMHLTEDSRLRPLIHSGKYRTKDPERLRDKLRRKEEEIAQQPARRRPLFSQENLCQQVEDLAGVRILHLHTKQMEKIHPTIIRILSENNYRLIRKAVVYFWDLENQRFFDALGIRTVPRKEMYTSVHYIVASSQRPNMKLELQVRTLMEEVWGEVSHSINYPGPTTSVSCKEQLMALARISSGCTRLVDSIFATHGLEEVGDS